MRHTATLLAGAVVLALLPTSAGRADDSRKSYLSPPTDTESTARGQVEIEGRELEIKVEDLAPGASYGAYLDDGAGELALIGELTTNEDGRGELEMERGEPGDDGSDEHEAELPFGVENADQLAGRALEIRDSEGTVVLAGSTPDLRFSSDEGEAEFGLQHPREATDADAEGEVELKQQDGRAQIKVEIEHLEPVAIYEISLTAPDSGESELLGIVTTNDEGKGQLKVDTSQGDALPFGVGSLAELSGFGVAVSDANGDVVLMGILGAVEAPPPAADPGGSNDDESASCMQPVDPSSGARGEIEAEAEDDGDELKVKTKGLRAASVYAVSITSTDGASTESLGDITTNSDGKGELEVGDDGPLPLGAASVYELAGATIAITDLEGVAVLSGAVPAAGEDCDNDGGDDDDDGDDSPRIEIKTRLDAYGGQLEVELEHVAAGTEYSIVFTDADSGEAAALGTVTTDDEGEAQLELETENGDVLPLDAESVAELVGDTVEAIDADGVVVASGIVPSPAPASSEDGSDDTDAEESEDESDDSREALGGGGAVGEIADPFAIVGEFDTAFLRGDVNSDARLDIADSVNMLRFLFTAGAVPLCLDSADANDDGRVDISDPVRILLHLFAGAPAPSAPGAFIGGFDPTADALHCEETVGR